ncbi:MAG: hypothetical protein FJZ01_22070 [Candidatus Sericytochromatia bacterium]|nr:hypothetical protein [Candidatus Tanganyikabacteria bacterium]
MLKRVATSLLGVALAGCVASPGILPGDGPASLLAALEGSGPAAGKAPAQSTRQPDSPGSQPTALGDSLPAAGVGNSGFGVQFVRTSRKVQAIAGVNFEIRCMYTEAVVRSNADLADYHVGVKAMPNSLTGYSLNVPAPGAQAGTGVPRLRYAQHTVGDDPLYPHLLDGNVMLNPTTDPSVYFLGQGILKTAHAGGFPAQVADAFNSGVSSTPMGSVADLQGAKLSFANAEALFSGIWLTGVSYTASASFPLAAVVQDRPLTDNTTLTNTRYYKWRFPFSATSFSLGSGLPLGRLIFDLRVLDAANTVTAWGATQLLLQPGSNGLVVTINDNGQGLGTVTFSLPK